MDKIGSMEEITMKKIALLSILICSIELTNWKKSDMLVDKTENEGCLRNKKFKGGFVMTELQVKTKKGNLKKFLAMFLAVCVCMTTFQLNGMFASANSEEPKSELATATKDDATKDDATKDDSSKDEPTPTVTPTPVPTTPAAKPTTPAAKPTTPAAKPTTPAAKPTTPAAKPTTPAVTPVPTVTPTPAPTQPTKKTVKVSKVSLSAKTIYLQFGKKITVGASVEPKNATNKKLTWKSNKTGIATVSNKGVITAKKKAGKATITVTANSNKKAKATVTVNVVKKATKVKSVTLKDAKVNVGETVALQPTYNPKKATISKVAWKSSNTKIASVSNGIVTGKKVGVATITVTADKKSAKCVVSVSKKNTTLTLKKTSGTVKVGKTIKIATKKIGKKDSIKSYTSSNKKVATVNKKGVVKGVKKGNAVITVQTKKGAVATFKVTVKKK